MKKFRCISDKEKDWPGFIIEGNFPNEMMICFPLKNMLKTPIEDAFILMPVEDTYVIPEKTK